MKIPAANPTNKAPAKAERRTEYVEFKRADFIRAGGSVEQTADGFRVSFAAEAVDHDPILNAMLDAGYRRNEAWEALDRMAETRIFRVLRQIMYE